MSFGDLRDQMHPRVARTVPSTPEATAILNDESIRPLAFGGLVTRLVELGAIEATGMDDIRTNVTEMLGIEVSEFDQMLANGNVINTYTAEVWTRNYKDRAEENLKKDKKNEVRSHLRDFLFSSLDDPNSARLADMVQTERDIVENLQAEIDEFEGKGLSARAIPFRMQLEAAKPKLKAYEASRYVVQLPKLLEILQGSALLFEHGDQVAQGTIQHVGASLKNLRMLPDATWLTEWFKGEREFSDYAYDDIPAIIENIWLPEETAVNVVTHGYVNQYYNYSDPGRTELDSLPNPVREAFYISDDEKAAFFLAFPLARDRQPH